MALVYGTIILMLIFKFWFAAAVVLYEWKLKDEYFDFFPDAFLAVLVTGAILVVFWGLASFLGALLTGGCSG